MADLSRLSGSHHRQPGTFARRLTGGGLTVSLTACLLASCATTGGQDDYGAGDYAIPDRAAAEREFGTFAPGGDQDSWMAQAGRANAPWFDRGIEAMRDEARASPDGAYRLALAHVQRIEALDRAGPDVPAGQPRAAIDAVRAAAPINSVLRVQTPELAVAGLEGMRSDLPLYGVPILIKDNIETFDMPTTAGSLALASNAPGRDAPLVAQLRQSGAVILGKANLSEWANIRSTNSTSGWSAVGGQTNNPHSLSMNPCGSSSGSAAAVAAGLAPAAIGTETDGSITCPAAVNGVVGFKPTVGLVSRTHIVPISHSQDTAGPITRSVRDAALVLNAIAGSDPADRATGQASARRVDYVASLNADSLRGTRIGVARFLMGYSPQTDAVFEAQLEVLRQAGAELIDINEGPDMEAVGAGELTVLLAELKTDLNRYLATTRTDQVATRTLADVIAFNRATPAELAPFGQELFERAEAMGGTGDPTYADARATSLRLAGHEGIDRLLRTHRVVALVAPTTAPAWRTNLGGGDDYSGSASTLPAVAGYPHLTVPMGFVGQLPVGMSFIGTAWDDARILSLGYAYEQRSRARRVPTLAR